MLLTIKKTCKITFMKSPEELSAAFRSSGKKVTPQRFVVWKTLADNEAHPTAEAIFESVRGELGTISLRTIYQILSELEEIGEIKCLDLGTGSARYDPNVLNIHHHLVCSICNNVRDLHVNFENLEVPIDLLDGYEVGNAEVIFRGLCRSCREENMKLKVSGDRFSVSKE